MKRLMSAACVLVMLGAVTRSAVGQPPSEEILAKLKAHRDALVNVVVESEWEEEWDGKATAWEHQKWTWDNLGRRRIVYEHGKIDEQGKREPPPEMLASDALYDGEVVAYQQYFPHRDRFGQTVDQGGKGYRSAIISDSAAPARVDLESHRNPIEYLRNIIIADLESCAAGNSPVTVKHGKTEGVYELEYVPVSKTSKSAVVRSVAAVDGGRGWAPIRSTAYGESDRVITDIHFDVGQDNGYWIPVSGSHKNWGDRAQDSAPIFDWRFTVKSFRVNDPNFDEKLFAVDLAPDTAVSDTRYKVAYRVGADRAVRADLIDLAQAARGDAQHEPVPSKNPYRAIIVINVLAFVILVAAVLFKRRRRPKALTVLVVLALWVGPSHCLADESFQFPENPYALDNAKCCGPRCLAFLDSYFSAQCRLEEVMAACPPGAMGTTLEQLQSAARNLGYHTAAFKNANIDQLQRMRFPSIIHLRGEAAAGHFMVILDCDQKTAALRGFNPPEQYGFFKPDEVAVRMTGTGLVVSDGPLPGFEELIRRESAIVTWLGSPVICVILLIAVVVQFIRPRSIRIPAKLLRGAGLFFFFLAIPILSACSRTASTVPAKAVDPKGTGNYAVNLGTVQEGAQVEHTFRLVNVSDKPFAIVDIEKSCTCQKVTVDMGQAIVPGSFLAIGISFATKGLEGPVGQRIVVHTDSAAPEMKAIPMSVHVEVNAGIKVIPTQVMFGKVQPEHPMRRKLQLRITQPELLNQSVSVEALNNPYLAIRLQERALGLLTYDVEIDSRMPPGPIYGQIKLRFDNSEVKDLVVPIVGTRLGNLNVVPKVVTINAAQQFPQTKLLRLSSSEGQTFRILRVEAPDGVTVRGADLEERSGLFDLEIEVQRRIDSNGVFLTLHLDDCDQKQLRLPILFGS